MHKVLIIILLGLVLISLGSGLVYFLKDKGGTKRTLHSLGFRVIVAVLLMAVIAHGIYTGDLQLGAPWHNRY